MPTIENIHGHDVLHLVHDAAPPLTRQALLAEAAQRWGADARFCTCSADGMTLPELLAFLMARGKIIEHEGKLLTDISKICAHGAEHHHE